LSLLVASEHARGGNLDEARDYYWRSIREWPSAALRRPLDMLVLAAQLYAPPAYRITKKVFRDVWKQ
jgi:hypothetical protein